MAMTTPTPVYPTSWANAAAWAAAIIDSSSGGTSPTPTYRWGQSDYAVTGTHMGPRTGFLYDAAKITPTAPTVQDTDAGDIPPSGGEEATDPSPDTGDSQQPGDTTATAGKSSPARVKKSA